MAYLLEHVRQSMDKDLSKSNPRQELVNYLKEPLRASGCNIVKWWKASTICLIFHLIYSSMNQRHSFEYPTLARMARDYLAVPASSTDSERVFSHAKLFGTDRRASLGCENFEAVQILRSALSSGLLTIEQMAQYRAQHAFANNWRNEDP
jgi:hypothetical protein